MAKLTKKDVAHVADLAQLTLSEEELDKFLPQLSQVIQFIGQLEEVDTTGVVPVSQTTGLTNVLREDTLVESSIDQTEAISGAGNTHKGFVKVKAILTQRSDK